MASAVDNAGGFANYESAALPTELRRPCAVFTRLPALSKGSSCTSFARHFFANARSSLRMAAAPYDFEGFQCEKCQSFHIRVDEVKLEAKRQAALAARESRPTYAERRAAQWNPETQSYDE
jgi:hypothetical protein